MKATRTGRERILDVLSRGPARHRTLQKLAGLGETQVRNLLNQLVNAGRVEKVNHELYRLTRDPGIDAQQPPGANGDPV